MSDVISELTVEDVYQQLKNDGGVLLDVRTEEEYRELHAKDTVLLPLSDIDPESIEKLNIPKDKPIYIICRSGVRSMTACEIFAENGYTKLVNVAGGTIAWTASELPTES